MASKSATPPPPAAAIPPPPTAATPPPPPAATPLPVASPPAPPPPEDFQDSKGSQGYSTVDEDSSNSQECAGTFPRRVPGGTSQFSAAKEIELAEMLRENQIFYDKTLRGFSKGKSRKIKLVEEKAKSFGVPVNAIETWIKTTRTQNGRLSRQETDGPSVQQEERRA